MNMPDWFIKVFLFFITFVSVVIYFEFVEDIQSGRSLIMAPIATVATLVGKDEQRSYSTTRGWYTQYRFTWRYGPADEIFYQELVDESSYRALEMGAKMEGWYDSLRPDALYELDDISEDRSFFWSKSFAIISVVIGSITFVSLIYMLFDRKPEFKEEN